MNRKVLLIEPNYKNKYPPIGLMKLATYYRMVGDDVRFYKGDMRMLAVDLIATYPLFSQMCSGRTTIRLCLSL